VIGEIGQNLRDHVKAGVELSSVTLLCCCNFLNLNFWGSAARHPGLTVAPKY